MTPPRRDFFDTLMMLFRKGVRYSTVIDVGCADGDFFLLMRQAGLAPDAKPVNLDANAIYEPSLKSIKQAVGGDYRICAVSDHEGESPMVMSVHPYWSSLRPPDDPYWQRINGLATTTTTVPVTTLDALSSKLEMKPPFLLKMDIQGAEAAALRGGAQLLKQTHAVICETDVDDFDAVHATMVKSGFVLYDVTMLSYVADGELGWFYPVYISRALEAIRPKAFWDPTRNREAVGMQEQRRQSILSYNARILGSIAGKT